jgi:hypothetical protein
MSANRNIKPNERGDDALAGREPRTELGRKLAAARAEIVSSGEHMLSDEELEREIDERRGGYYRGARDE